MLAGVVLRAAHYIMMMSRGSAAADCAKALLTDTMLLLEIVATGWFSGCPVMIKPFPSSGTSDCHIKVPLADLILSVDGSEVTS